MRHDFAQPNFLDFAWQLISCGQGHFNSFPSRKERCDLRLATSLLLNFHDLDSLQHTNPAGGAFFLWCEDAKGSLAVGQRLAIRGVCDPDLGIGEGRVQLGQAKTTRYPSLASAKT